MSLKNNNSDQLRVLMTGAIDINHASLKHRRQNIIVAHKLNDILMLITTTQFDLILLDLTANFSVASAPDRLRHSHHPWQSELMAHIKDPLGINNKTPIIAIVNPAQDALKQIECPIGFNDSLISPIPAERLNEIIDLWQTKALVLIYIQIILSKTKNNQRLTLTLFEKLFEELPLQIATIEDALENKQYDLAQTITHKLNGSASFCGLTAIQQQADALESSLLKNDYASIEQQFLMLHQHTLNFTRLQKPILKSLSMECQTHKKSP